MTSHPANLGSTLVETTVAHAMHPGVMTCPPETALRDVARMMARYRIHAVVVFSEDEDALERPRVWGVVSDTDLISAAAVDDIDGRTAGGTAKTPLVTVSGQDRLEDAAELMERHGVMHLVVVAPSSDRPVGVISSLDIAQAIALEPRFEG